MGLLTVRASVVLTPLFALEILSLHLACLSSLNMKIFSLSYCLFFPLCLTVVSWWLGGGVELGKTVGIEKLGRMEGGEHVVRVCREILIQKHGCSGKGSHPKTF